MRDGACTTEGERTDLCLSDAWRRPSIRPWPVLDLRHGLGTRRGALSIASAFGEQAGAPDCDVGASAAAHGGGDAASDDAISTSAVGPDTNSQRPVAAQRSVR